MYRFKTFTHLLTLLFIPFLLIYCSDDDPVSTNGDLDEASFTIAGDINTELDGIARFGTSGTGDEETSWEITIADTGPQTFVLVISTIDLDGAEQPSTGFYSITNSPTAEGEFSAIFTDMEGDEPGGTEYSTIFGNEGGTLEITESSSSQVSGNFSFTAVTVDDQTNEVVGEIVVTEGEFVATPMDD